MLRTRRTAFPAALLWTAALCAAGCAGAAEGDRGAGEELVVRRGDLRSRLLLTGELVAQRAVELKVPRTPSWQVQIRWMAEDGTAVRAGDRVVELDNSSFTSELEDKRASAADADTELARKQAETRSTLAEREWTVDQRRSELEKAHLDAAIPPDLLSAREYQERQLAVRRAEVGLAKAERDLAAHREASAADLEVQGITLRSTEREIAQAEEAIDALILRAPRDGIILSADHPWEGRKLREGDNIWVGMTAAILPDLSSLQVQAELSDVDDGRIQPGMEAICTLDAYPAASFHGRVVDISAVANESSPRQPLLRSFLVQIRLDRLDAQKMRPGMSVRVEVLGPEVRNALLVPRAAVDFTAERPRVVFAGQGGGTAREIRLGPCDASFCVVEQGLEEGARLWRRGGGAG